MFFDSKKKILSFFLVFFSSQAIANNSVCKPDDPSFNVDETHNTLRQVTLIGLSSIPNAGALIGGTVGLFWKEDSADIWEQIRPVVEKMIDGHL